MMATKAVASGYDRYIDWKKFSIPLGLFVLLLIAPTPGTMLDVGVEYAMGTRYVEAHFSEALFGKKPIVLEQWEMLMVRMMEASVQKSSFKHPSFLKRSEKWCKANHIPVTREHLKQVMAFAQTISPDRFEQLLRAGLELRTQQLTFEGLKAEEKTVAAAAGFRVKAAVGLVLFVVACFLTEAIPLPMVAFCVGIIALSTGMVTREEAAGLYWSDATWFILGSLMFAAAFVKTGVDKRIAMVMFGRLKKANVRWVTLIMILVISPLTMFMSDHALAAMFLPIVIVLYSSSVVAQNREDPELASMLLITLAMACNLGGSLAPSGGARNIIMMSYVEDMFGVSIGFGQWCLYNIPFLLFMIPITWLVINWRFKPVITDIGEAMSVVREEVVRSGGKWTRQQKIAIFIFLVMFLSWVTESNLLVQLTGIRFGIGALAIMGAIAYVLTGIVNWRDYQTKVDWGVIWLYAGAIVFGRVLVQTGGAYWIARSILDITAPFGVGTGLLLLLAGNLITGLMTQLMADGPACAAVGPVVLAMAGIAHPGTSMIPMMAMGTAVASSFAYCLVIGTPPNAIVYASGHLGPKDFLRVGVILWFTNMAGLMLMTATYWRWLGWSGLPPY